jgi:CRISPR-associated protein Cas2
MLVVLANELPPAVRGRMKLWFVEPRPNVFVSGINDAVADSVVEYLHQYCPVQSGVMIFQKINKVPGYKIRGIGLPGREIIHFNGLQLIQEKKDIKPTI